MAGAGYKLFNTGDVLTAQQVNEYLMQQTVMVFADATARTTALSGVLAEGMLSYLKSTDATEVYNGSAWVALAADQTPLTTKGDLFTYTTTDARLAVGADNTVLTADSTTATGLKWAAASSGGANWSLLNSGGTTLSGSSTTISGISAADKIFVWIDAVYTNSTSNSFTMRINNDTGTNYTYGGIRISPLATYSANMFDHTKSLTATGLFLGTFSANAASQASGWVLLNGCNSAGLKQYTQAVGTDRAATSGEGATFNWFGGVYSGSSTVSSLVFITSAGTFSGGKVYVYTKAIQVW